jgi:hypothetical protein
MNEENPNDNGSVRVRKRKEIEDMPRVGDPNITLHSVECVFRRFLPPHVIRKKTTIFQFSLSTG